MPAHKLTCSRDLFIWAYSFFIKELRVGSVICLFTFLRKKGSRNDQCDPDIYADDQMSAKAAAEWNL